MWFKRRPFPIQTTLIICYTKEHAIKIRNAFKVDPQFAYFTMHKGRVPTMRIERVIEFLPRQYNEHELGNYYCWFNDHVRTRMTSDAEHIAI